MIWLPLVSACSSPPVEFTPLDGVVLDFEATCAREWPEDTCVDGDCATTDVEARWISAYDTAFAAVTGIPEGSVADHARVRSITGAPDTTSVTEVSTQFDIDWVRVVNRHVLQADGPDDADLLDRWLEGIAAPELDLDAELMDYTTAQAYIDDCAQQLEVTFDPTGWCTPGYYPRTDQDFSEPSQLRFDFRVPFGDDYDYIQASVDLTGNREPTCGIQQVTID